MSESIRILIVEDLPTDAELAEREIRKVLTSCLFRRVETREDYLAALETFRPDLIISDYRMPRFDGLTALKLTLERTPLTPLIILTGAMNEDTAVECMKAGAADYVIKEHIKRLGQAVIHALEEKQLRLERRTAEERIRREAARTETLVRTAARLNATLDLDSALQSVCEETAKALDVPIVNIFLYDEESDMLSLVTALGIPTEDYQYSPQFPRSMLDKITFDETNQQRHSVVTVPDLREFSNLPHTRERAQTRGRSLTFAVMQYGDRLIGTLGVTSISKKRELSPDELDLLEGIAGQAAMAISNARLFTQQKLVEEALRESEERYRTLVRTLPDPLTVIDLDGNITYVSSSTLHSFGYETEEKVLGQNVLNWVHGSYQRQALNHIEIVLAGGFITNKEYLLLKKDGSAFFGEVSASCLTDSQGQAIGIIIIVRDISERKQAEEQLLYQANLLQNVSDAIIAVDLSFNITNWNQAAEALYGWKANEVVGRPADEILQTEYSDDAPEQVRRQLLEQGLWKGEVIQKHRDGTPIHMLVSSSLVKNSTGKPVGAVAVNRDITERKQAEEVQAKLEQQLRQAQKMESIGRLAGGVAHDFNNLLTVIQGYTELMQVQISTENPLLKDLEQIQRAGERAAALTRQLLAFSRKQILAPTVLDLNSLVSNLRKMLGRLIGEDITLSTVLQPGLWPVTADPSQIEQVIMNLIVNARDAMPTGGLLTLETGNVYLDDDYARTHLDGPTGPCVMLAVTDTGHGMDEQTRTRIFEPFFTTKESGKGTGLGLATAYGIIKQSGGDITIYSEPGQGTTFKIYLPAGKTVSNGMAAPQSRILTGGGQETILLVEDEEMVRRFVRVALQDKGYTILEARNGDEALSLAQQHEGSVDLLVTDVVMPQMSGRELAERLKVLRPPLKVLFMSGYTDDAVVRHGLLAAEVEFLPKPFSPGMLTSKVREVLDK